MIWILLAISVIAGTITSPYFLTVKNIINILEHASILGVLVIAQSINFMSSSFDLSVESTLGFTGMLGAWLITASGSPSYGSGFELHPILALLVMFAVGALIGIINGFFITRVKMVSFVVTLSMLLILRGAAMVVNSGITVANLPKSFIALGFNKIGIMPVSVIVVALMFLGAHILTRYTQFGRNVLAVGGNKEAAIASGIDAGKLVRRVYIISGLLATFAGWMYVGRIASANALMGSGIIFEVNAAAVIGGVSLFGGRGTMAGSLGGVLLMSTITTILQLMGISAFFIEIVRGAAILFALYIDSKKTLFEKRVSTSAITSVSKA